MASIRQTGSTMSAQPDHVLGPVPRVRSRRQSTPHDPSPSGNYPLLTLTSDAGPAKSSSCRTLLSGGERNDGVQGLVLKIWDNFRNMWDIVLAVGEPSVAMRMKASIHASAHSPPSSNSRKVGSPGSAPKVPGLPTIRANI